MTSAKKHQTVSHDIFGIEKDRYQNHNLFKRFRIVGITMYTFEIVSAILGAFIAVYLYKNWKK